MQVADTALPAWALRSAGGAYELAVAESDTTHNSGLNLPTSGTHTAIRFVGYDFDSNNPGTVTTNGILFTVQPDLHLYASGATNEIVQPIISSISPYPGQVAQALQFVQFADERQRLRDRVE